ncbi:MAG: hypothetical protein N2691_02805 [Patescibacteria group bacterium]|nr:hypothetical protein [Patescibacteria group bacterium]
MKSYSMKQWKTFLREALSSDGIKQQFDPGSHLVRIFMFSAVASITLGVIYSFVGQYLVGTRASTETITVTTGASKDRVASGEEFTVNVLFSAPAGKKVSQLDLRMTIRETPVTAGKNVVEYVTNGFESAEVGKSETNYFDTKVLETYTAQTGSTAGQYRLVLSSLKPESQLAQRVLVKVKFRAAADGSVAFNLTPNTMEIVGPGGTTGEPVSYSIGAGSSTQALVQIGEAARPSPTDGPSPTTQPTPTPATDVGPSPTITIAPNPTCSNTSTCLPDTAPVPVSVLPGREMPVS